MADKEADLKIVVGSKVDEGSAEQTGKDIVKTVKKGIGNNGYIKLPVEITKFKYPKRDEKALSGPRTIDYSGLQKAQDELLSSWKKLSKKGFSSDDESVFNSLKAYREYEKAVKKQYSGTDDLKDPQVMKIRSTIGNQLTKYFTRLAPANFGDGKQGSFMRLERNSEFEKYAKTAIRRYKVAQEAGIDLSKSELSKEDRSIIIETEKKLLKQAYIDKTLAQRKYEKEHAEEIKEAEQKELQKIEKERAETSEKAIPIPKSDKPLDDITFKTTKVEDLTSPRDYTPTIEDKKENKRFLNAIENSAPARKMNTPNNELNLGTRQQVWDPTYLTKDFIQKMERGGTYVDTNALLRQTMQALPEEIKKSIEGLVVKIDKDKALKAFTTFNSSEKKQWSDVANQTGMSQLLLTNVAKVQGALMSGKPGVSSEDLKNAIIVAVNDALQNGKSAIAAENYKSAISSITNMLMNRYNNMKEQIGSTDGSEYGVGVNYEGVMKTLKEVFKDFEDTAEELLKRAIKEFPEFYGANSSSKTDKKETTTTFDQVFNEKLKASMTEISNQIKAGTKLTDTQLAYDKIENVREATADSNEKRISKENKDINRDVARTVKSDAATGFNTDAKSDELIQLVRSILQQLQGVKPKTSPNTTTDYSIEMKKAWDTLKDSVSPAKTQTILNSTGNTFKNYNGGTGVTQETPRSNRVEKSKIYASPIRQSVWDKFETAIERITGATDKYRNIINATAEDQDLMAAERIRAYGLNNGRNPNDTGDIASIKRALELFRTNKSSIEDNPELMQKIKLTPGVEVDTTEITKKLNEQLSGKQMRNAQMGGSIPRQILGSLTGFIGMPSLEKSRAQADGLNQIMGNINKALQSVLINIQMKETELSGMEQTGQAKFTKEGYLTTDSSSAAKKTLADLEEEKLVLSSILADMSAVDQIVDITGGKFSKLVKQLSFTSPVLRENNGILRNINSGLDKNGKALKFQTRTAEILNYAFQLMSRSVGQMLKNWLVQLNPITQIKRLLQDFMSYDAKWQRTMNVIKYNLRDIVRPFMEWIAQKLVDIIGFIDIISMKIQEAFGYTPISLFDQKNADEFKKTYEEISSVSAGFDELHDIGSSSSENDPNNLLGEIYKPQLSQAWKDLANEIGDLFAGIITGDLGFSEVMLKILDIAWKGVKTLWNEILWPFIKNTIWPAIKDNWLEILAWILGAFVAWKGLKLIGQLLWNAISGAFIKGAGTNLLRNLFTDSNGIVGIGRNLGTLIAGGILTVISTMALTDAINDAWNQGKSDANTGQEMNLNDRQTNMDALKGALGGAGAVLGGGMIATALGASVALGPLLAVAAGVAALTAVVVVGAEAWAYHSQQNKIANNEMLKASDYAEQAAATQEKLNEVTDMVNNGLEIKNSNQEKLNQLEEEYGISLDYVNQKVEAAGGNTSILTEKERALYEQGKLTQESIDNYNRLLEIQIELQKQQLWQKEQEAIALDMEAGNYELATLRIEQAELQGLITTEEATAKRIQLYKTCGEEERANLLQNLTPEQRTLMAQYTNATDEELAELAKLWRESSEDVKQSLLDGVGPEVQTEFERRMDDIDKTIKEHQGFWQGVGDTLKEIFTAGNYTSWTYNGEEKYYKEGYDKKWAESEIQSIQNDDTLSEEEKRRRIQNIRNMASYAVGTNYVPNDGLAYLHQGEAVIPKKYNQPYQPASMSPEEIAYMNQMMNTMRSLDNTMKQGITVNGQFVQRGSDLVSVINRTKSQSGADLLSNVSYAR